MHLQVDDHVKIWLGQVARFTFTRWLPRAHAQGVKRYLLSVACLSVRCLSSAKKKFKISYKQILLRLIIVS